MTMMQRLRLTLEDGREIETTYDGRDLRAWEAKEQRSAFTAELSVSDVTWLGHHAAIRRGELNGPLTTYDAFDKACTWVEGLPDDEGPPDPPKAARPRRSPKKAGADSSAPSP